MTRPSGSGRRRRTDKSGEPPAKKLKQPPQEPTAEPDFENPLPTDSCDCCRRVILCAEVIITIIVAASRAGLAGHGGGRRKSRKAMDMLSHLGAYCFYYLLLTIFLCSLRVFVMNSLFEVLQGYTLSTDASLMDIVFTPTHTHTPIQVGSCPQPFWFDPVVRLDRSRFGPRQR